MQNAESTSTPTARSVDGVPVPKAGVYEFDPVHTFATFATRHIRVGRVRGRFTRVRGTITVDEDPSRTAVDLVVETASVNTDQEVRDEDLRSSRFFDVASFPTMTYRSSRAAYDGDGIWEVDGELTIRSVTRPLRLRASFRGVTLDGRGRTRAGFHAVARLRRQDFNLMADLPNEVGGLPVGSDVSVEVDAEAVLRN